MPSEPKRGSDSILKNITIPAAERIGNVPDRRYIHPAVVVLPYRIKIVQAQIIFKHAGCGFQFEQNRLFIICERFPGDDAVRLQIRHRPRQGGFFANDCLNIRTYANVADTNILPPVRQPCCFI